MTIEELKALPEDWCQGLESCAAADALIALRIEILALVEAVSWDISESETEMIPCGCDRPVCVALRAFNAKLASL